MEAPKWRARAAAAFEDVVEALTDVEWDLLKKMRDDTPNLQGRDVGNALRSVSTAKGINTDKANLLRGEATVRIQHDFTYEQLEAAQRALLESVVDAELVEPPESPEGDQ